jgi:AcrR family transcriptional regulator
MIDRPRPRPTRRARPRKSLGREAWIEAALKALSSDGIAGVRVELLARRLGITKGSFYHHFQHRDDLHIAMLSHWRRQRVIEVISDLEKIGDPRERFRQLLRLPLIDGRADLDVEFAVRLWARSDSRAQHVLREVDNLRLDYLRRVIVACDVPPEQARSRAVLTLAFLRTAHKVDKALLAQCESLLISRPRN